LPQEAEPEEVLTHLNLLDDGRPTHAAVLLFGSKPQSFLLPTEVKCAHYHGIEAEARETDKALKEILEKIGV
jgi:predicted HTH transcriptional regulator